MAAFNIRNISIRLRSLVKSRALSEGKLPCEWIIEALREKLEKPPEPAQNPMKSSQHGQAMRRRKKRKTIA